MGDIADAIIDGEFDYITGEYIGHGVGYPRSLHDNVKEKGKNQVWGVVKFLLMRGISDPKDHAILVERFTGQSHFNTGCVMVQKDFSSFVKFVKNVRKSSKTPS